MRSDMFKVIVEHPRWASRHAPAAKLKKRTHPDLKFIGHKRHAKQSAAYTKSLSENLNPLARYLKKQRGRPWDKVFSEICEHLDTGSTVKMHVREHIEDFIMVKIHVDGDGNWIGHRGHWGARPLDSWWPTLYVDPFDGIIKETEKLRRKLRVKRVKRYGLDGQTALPAGDDFKRLSPTRVLTKRKGLWFEVRLNADPGLTDRQLRSTLKADVLTEETSWWIASTKQLPRKELRKHKLANDGSEA